MLAIAQSAPLILADIFDRVASDLAMLSDRDFEILSVDYEDRTDRPAGLGVNHISFRFGVVDVTGVVHHGAMLIPMPEAVSLAAYLMMKSDEVVAELRNAAEIDHSTKEALLEIGNFVAAAGESALRTNSARAHSVIFEGCQGVRADLRPALDYEEGTPLAVGRAQAAIAGGAPVELLVMVPRTEILASS